MEANGFYVARPRPSSSSFLEKPCGGPAQQKPGADTSRAAAPYFLMIVGLLYVLFFSAAAYVLSMAG